MAGEIPDRSEQKKAAGEPEAPAAGAPAPATDDRDPRIAVARETPDPVDHATTVLRTDGGRDGGSDGDGAGEGESVKPAGAGTGADAEGDAGAGADAESAGKADVADEAGVAGEARDAEAGSGAEGAGTAGEAGGSAKGEDAGGEADGSAEAEAEAGADGEAGAGKADAVSGKSGTGAGADGRLRDAVAAWVATDDADETDEKGKSGEGGVDSADADADEAAGGGEEGAEGASEAAEESVRGTGGPKVPEAREAGDSESECESEPDAGAGADADGSDDADADAEAEAEADDAPKPAGDAAVDKPAESEAGGEEPSAKADGESGGAGESGVKKDAGHGPVPAQGGKPVAGAEKAEAGDEEAADGEDAAVVSTGVKLRKVGKREGVDQPTAVFRAPKSGPEVDQPTTMLKVGDAKPEAEKAEKAEKADKGAGGEAEAERTSKFVPLRGLEGPAAVKPKPAEPKPAEAEEEAPQAKAAVPAPAAPADETAALPAAERTTQQPLPPLDLLAELTNTPPPPETPLRTAVRRVKIWTPLVILLLIVFAVVQSVRPLPEGTLALTAEETYTFKGEEPAMPWPTEGQATVTVDGIGSLGSYGEQKPIPIGSVAKVMTAYTILREHPVKKGTEGEMLTIDAKAQRDYENAGQESTVKVTEGQKISVKEAIEAIMLPSANNIARQLARWDSDGDEAAFVEKMNKYAAELGMENTTYTDPSGLKETTVSSAEDQVKLGKAVMEFETFSSVVRLPNYESTTSGQTEKNYNFLVPMYGVVGIKTGSTTKAGGNLLFAAEKVVDGEKQLIIGAVFGQHAPPILDTATARSKDLILRTQELLTSKPVVEKGDVVGHVDDGLGSTTPVVATKDVPAVGWPGLTVKLALDDGGKALPHEAKAGTEVGVLSVGDGTGDAVEVPVALQSDLVEPSFGAKLQRIG
ncbi:D-alanyl-D-alanine carboxypeptidase [Streptomyces sp. CHA1]|uniref:serine hydrolase n=1 Tax=unclassified Streptomyces TaxID=2593676 RepID=UPI001BFCBD45|nr:MULTISPECIES: serine hydrolase [unclassified Streptomyces]MBT3160293.1 D-alanyl-D-alanine carboxypeptidase [Streptomyces sp. G11C]MCO6701162.1 D-alanyl-D-alanine carboxypeptidase [Streptomyces sp. CHB9.2]MCO6707378.1 D-alanyl-D-alanine carboxypeptidase [Streptomyces sp. CHA3]MCO6713115.1 D-alanyl-D-alanine carboxypeptidase [Streptomyces sp. CHB19.2]MCO6719443.1 D-alanyl-D-alanine carboxypeptidase [Streptomyces sp. Vc714c-19]